MKTKKKQINKSIKDVADKDFIYFDKEEKDLIESFGNTKIPESVDVVENKKYMKFFKDSRRKTKQINIRLTQQDLLKFKARANESGIPYQTLLTSLIHKYNNGDLVEM